MKTYFNNADRDLNSAQTKKYMLAIRAADTLLSSSTLSTIVPIVKSKLPTDVYAIDNYATELQRAVYSAIQDTNPKDYQSLYNADSDKSFLVYQFMEPNGSKRFVILRSGHEEESFRQFYAGLSANYDSTIDYYGNLKLSEYLKANLKPLPSQKPGSILKGVATVIGRQIDPKSREAELSTGMLANVRFNDLSDVVKFLNASKANAKAELDKVNITWYAKDKNTGGTITLQSKNAHSATEFYKWASEKHDSQLHDVINRLIEACKIYGYQIKQNTSTISNVKVTEQTDKKKIPNDGSSIVSLEKMKKKINDKLKDIAKYDSKSHTWIPNDLSMAETVRTYLQGLSEAEEKLKTFNKQINKIIGKENFSSTLSSLMSRVARINNFACTGRWFCPECGKEMESSKCCNSCGYTC